jgi:hypothetical protein
MRRNNLYQTSTERRQLLEESYKYQTFERDCDETKSWINEKLKTASDENYMSLHLDTLSHDSESTSLCFFSIMLHA